MTAAQADAVPKKLLSAILSSEQHVIGVVVVVVVVVPADHEDCVILMVTMWGPCGPLKGQMDCEFSYVTARH